jgi:hypothetical protein
MTVKPAVVFADPEHKVIDRLVACSHTGVSTRHPSSTLAGSATRIQVEHESTPSAGYPQAARAQVRITAHAAPGKRDDVKALAAQALSDLYTFEGDADVTGIFPASLPSGVTTDPTTRNEMCWVLVRVNLKASLAP